MEERAGVEEAVGAPPELHCPRGAGSVQRNGRRRRAPCGADELGDAVEPFFVDVVDGTVAQELVRRDECSPSLHGRAESRDEEPDGVSEGVAVRPSCRTDGC